MVKISLLALIVFISLSSSVRIIESPSQTTHWPRRIGRSVTINLREEFQTIHSFGASDCWSAKFIGKWHDERKKNHIADLLFSLDTLPDGQPRGIGLSLWRMNVGAGSYEQGDSSHIGDP